MRKIASNLLWTPQGIVRRPLVTFDAEGRVRSVEVCDAPDREPFTEFFAGLMVTGFPAAYREAFDRLRACADEPLTEALARIAGCEEGVAVVISGLDYASMRLTERSSVARIA